MTISARPLLLAPVLLLLATGYTDCEYFTDVTVPASDTGAPTTYDGVWVGGEYVDAALAGDSLEYHLAPGQTVLAVSSAIDSGGLRKLKMSTDWGYTCCRGDICSRTQPLSVPKTDEQAGGVGATVSNGLWLYTTVKLPTCSSGFTLRSYSYSWWTEAEDFHGNRTTGEMQSIVYP